MKHETRVDSRTIETKAVIRKTVEDMIVEMNMDQITISELTRRAGLHRKTFYLHYESLPQLFDQLADDIYSEIIDLLEANMQDGVFDISSLFKVYTDFLEQKGQLHRKLFTSESYRSIFDRVQDKASRYLLERYQYADSQKTAACISFLAYGTNAVWRLNYMKKDPVPQEIIGSWASEWISLLLGSIENRA